MRTNANLSRLLPIFASQRLALDPHSRNLYVLKDLSAAIVAVCERGYSDVEVDCQEWLARKMWTQSSVLQVLEDRAVSSAICWWPMIALGGLSHGWSQPAMRSPDTRGGR
jgi:hypothetical protein